MLLFKYHFKIQVDACIHDIYKKNNSLVHKNDLSKKLPVPFLFSTDKEDDYKLMAQKITYGTPFR